MMVLTPSLNLFWSILLTHGRIDSQTRYKKSSVVEELPQPVVSKPLVDCHVGQNIFVSLNANVLRTGLPTCISQGMSLSHGKAPSPCRTLSPNPVSPMKPCPITSSTATSPSHIDLLNFRRGQRGTLLPMNFFQGCVPGAMCHFVILGHRCTSR